MPSSKFVPYWSSEFASLYLGETRAVMQQMPARSIHCCVTSPPYWNQRDYGESDQIGLEPSADCETFGQAQCGKCFVCSMVSVFRQVRRILRDDGTVWLNLGDKFDGGQWLIPSRVGIALRADGWHLAQKIIWHAPNKMPNSAEKRCTNCYEEILLLAKSSDYYFDSLAIREPGKVDETEMVNKRDVWSYPVARYPGAHTATFTPELITPCILAGTSECGCCSDCGKPYEQIVHKTEGEPGTSNGKERDRSFEWSRNGLAGSGSTLDGPRAAKRGAGWRKTCKCSTEEIKPCAVLDPFLGSGTTVATACELGRFGVGIELSGSYLKDCAIPRIASTKVAVSASLKVVSGSHSAPRPKRMDRQGRKNSQS